MSFKYLGCHITSDRNLYKEVKEQTIKGSKISGHLRDVVWINPFMTIESKMKIYKTTVRPITTYEAETRAETERTKQLLRTTEMKTLKSAIGVTLWDRMRNKDVKDQCNIQDIKNGSECAEKNGAITSIEPAKNGY